MFREIRPAIVIVVALTLICGFAYPLAMTAIAQLAFPVLVGSLGSGAVVADGRP